ncbi:hypothetical protein [Halorientalis pallida]|nr:hypothetical protein [Halorientalis pallida]
MTDTDAVETFLDEAGTVYEEYDQGYMNPDVALERLRGHVEDLEDATNE